MTRAQLPTIREVLGGANLRLILFAVLLAAASVTVSGALAIRNYAQRNLDLMARTVAYTVEPGVVFGDRSAIVEGISSVAGGGGVQEVEVRDAGGHALVRWENRQSGLPRWLRDGGNRLFWRRPATAALVYNGARIGEVRIVGNPEGLLRFALAGTIIALCTLGLTIVASRILARRLDSDVVGSLERVAEVAHAVRAGRRFDQRIPAAAIAEIDRLSQDFNALVAELQDWQATHQTTIEGEPECPE